MCVILSLLTLLLFATGLLITSDTEQTTANMITAFFVNFAADGALLLTDWMLIEALSHPLSGRALSIATFLTQAGTMIILVLMVITLV